MLGSALTPSARAATAQSSSSFADLIRQPDVVEVWTQGKARHTLRPASEVWTDDAGHVVRCSPAQGELAVQLRAPQSAVTHVLLRWHTPAAQTLRVLGDAWERSYGNLEWQEMAPARPLPWYFLTFDGTVLHGYGVRTGAGALAFWLRDNQGVSLWLDVRNGGDGVQLGGRTLDAATVATREGHAGESPMEAARAFCRTLCPAPRLLQTPVFGSNDWYYAYGQNTEAGILRDAALMRELAPTSGTRPFTVVDDGYRDPQRFPDLPGLAAKIAARGARPGIWVRPLLAAKSADRKLLLPAARFGSAGDQSAAYDPTIPEARELALAVVRQAAGWGFELIKHDFTTYDLLGQWGFAMGASPTLPGWCFRDPTRTNAEIILDLYRGIRAAAGERIVLSCNAVGHLAAGLFEMQRTGDDVSGRVWERTRRMGVNTLGLRLPQHGAFFTLDADCVPITPAIPWKLTEQWLQAVAQSGTLLLVSPDPQSMGAAQKQAVQKAFATAAAANSHAVPTDWMQTRTPEHWARGAEQAQYQWLEDTGAYPFTV